MALLRFCSLAMAGSLFAASAEKNLPKGAAEFMGQYCTECHNSRANSGGLDLTTLAFDASDPNNLAEWAKVRDRVEVGQMPPRAVKVRPDATVREAFLQSVSAALKAAGTKSAAVAERP